MLDGRWCKQEGGLEARGWPRASGWDKGKGPRELNNQEVKTRRMPRRYKALKTEEGSVSSSFC